MKCSTAASMRYPGIFFIICPFLLAVGCASNPPCLTSIGTSFITPSVASATGKYVGKPAQWGGTLLDTHHFKDRTEFEMIAYPLDGCGRPRVGFRPTGRFIIVHLGFLDTTDYQIGQAVSATGRIIGIRKGWLGHGGYRFPLLESYKVHPWPDQTAHGYHSHHSHGDYLYPWINLGIGGRRHGVFWRVGVTL